MLSKYRSHITRLSAPALSTAIMCFLLFYNQPYYPATWQDEGFVVQGAINLIRHGKYAMLSSEGFRVLDQPLIANGPGIVLPVLLGFHFFGPGLFQARMVAIVFAFIASMLSYRIAKELSGRFGAGLTLFLMVTVPLEGFLVYGRHALGIVPALVYFSSGLLIWFAAGRRESAKLSFLAGIVMGLAVITKGQYMIIIPAFAVTSGFSFLLQMRGEAKRLFITLMGIIVVLFIWLAAQFMIVGAGQFEEHLRAIQSSSEVTVVAFRLFRAPGSTWYLVRSGILICIIPGLVYSAYRLYKRHFADQTYLLLLSLLIIWLSWYVVASVGWHRYAFEPFVIGLWLSAGLFQDLYDNILEWREAGLSNSLKSGKSVAAFTYLGLICVIASVSLILHLRAILYDRNSSAEEFAVHLREKIDLDSTIESWEWELDLFAPLKFHHPSNRWVDEYTALIQFNEPLSSAYDPLMYEPEFLVDGPFSKWTGVYKSLLQGHCCERLISVGNYDLYAFHGKNGVSLP
jgi:4-amino-4-deoxy-L-arabinose transferase-like glycosyltransferase